MSKFRESVQNILDKFKMREDGENLKAAVPAERYRLGFLRGKYGFHIRIGLIAAVILIGTILIKYLVDHHEYKSYSVVSTGKMIDSSVTQYLELNGKMLRYSGDGATLSSAADRVLWSDSFQMTAPMVTSFGSTAAIYDQQGTQIAVYNEKGKLGSFRTEYPVIKASVSARGAVAAILEESDNMLINYYTTSGSLIASSVTNMKNPGYPIDLSVSQDGISVAVSYLVPDGDTISSYLAFYNFGDEGKNKEDNLVEGFRFGGVLIPKVRYLDKNTLVAYREDGFTVYKGSTPKEKESVTFEEEIVSSFGDGEQMGFVFNNNNSDHPFRMEVYNASGKRQMETEFDIVYDEIKLSGGQIIMNNATQVSVYSMKGIEKYTGNIEEGNIFEVLKTGMNRYTIAYNGGVITIKLK